MERSQKVNKTMKKQNPNPQLKRLIQDVLAFGDLLLVGNKGTGKTNALMWLARYFRALPDTRVIVFEDFPKWSLDFDEIPFLTVKDSWIQETSKTINIEDIWLKHESSYTITQGSLIERVLKQNKDILFLMEISDIERTAFFIYSIIQHFYRKNYLRKAKNVKKTKK